MYAEVVLAKVSRGLDKVFHYAIPAELKNKLLVGHQVVIPFGRRRDIGYVVGFVATTEFKGIKEVLSLAGERPLFNERAVLLAKWVAEHYLAFFMTALRLVMPPGGKLTTNKGEITNNSQLTTANSQHILNLEQQAALNEITGAIELGKPETFLLFGVTGSGKTEVYMRAIERVLAKGEGAIVLVPEIALTPQLVERFGARFPGRIAVLHSELTLKQRRLAWERISAGAAQIVLGARSALFAPVPKLGLIVIDEEYETSYKSDQSPRYHARETARELARLNDAVLVLGSATPALESYYRAEQGADRLLTLAKRIDDRPLPPVEVIDLRQEMKRKNYGVLSERLRDELRDTLSRGEQAILFINRLGYFTFVMCRECGYVVECPKCSVSLVYHSSDQRLRCNKCEHSQPPPSGCPRCHSPSIKYFGTGTQRIEQEVARVFPAARILRYDRDTVSKRGSHDLFFAAFAQGKADVLIGTQMVTKGLDVANVTLVGVVAADTALNLPDFRAAERTFQLLTQVAGRAGRHHLAGKVIVQTYNPGHYAVQTAAKHDYLDFYRQELAHRRELNYPPFTGLVSLLVSGEDKEKAARLAAELCRFLAKRHGGQLLGPAPAAIPKLRGEWRYHLLLKGDPNSVTRNAIRESLDKLVVPDDLKVTIDVDPLSLL